MMTAGTIKNQKCSIIRHFVWDKFEFSKEPNCSFWGVILALLKAKTLRKHLNETKQ